jgi:hypothetical protein
VPREVTGSVNRINNDTDTYKGGGADRNRAIYTGDVKQRPE